MYIQNSYFFNHFLLLWINSFREPPTWLNFVYIRYTHTHFRYIIHRQSHYYHLPHTRVYIHTPLMLCHRVVRGSTNVLLNVHRRDPYALALNTKWGPTVVYIPAFDAAIHSPKTNSNAETLRHRENPTAHTISNPYCHTCTLAIDWCQNWSVSANSAV